MVKVLIAEDESMIRLDLVESLTALDLDVVAAVGDGQSAIDSAHETKPDVILLDVKMPKMDGLTAAEVLISEGYCCILITAFSSADIVSRATEIGVDGYIVKPWRIDSLKPAIEIGYSQFLRRKNLANQLTIGLQELEEHKLVDRARAIIISKYQLTENEAFKVMQRAAMDGRKPMIDIAQSIIDAN